MCGDFGGCKVIWRAGQGLTTRDHVTHAIVCCTIESMEKGTEGRDGGEARNISRESGGERSAGESKAILTVPVVWPEPHIDNTHQSGLPQPRDVRTQCCEPLLSVLVHLCDGVPCKLHQPGECVFCQSLYMNAAAGPCHAGC